MPRSPLPLLPLAGPALVAARPPWSSTAPVEDHIVAATWLVALAVWAWLTTVGALHGWATRTGRRRWRRVTARLLPARVRRSVEHLALAGLLVAPVAACSVGAEAPAAPVLVLEGTAPIDPVDPAGPGTGTSTLAPPLPAPTSPVPPSTAPPGTTTVAPHPAAPDPAAPDPAAPPSTSPAPPPTAAAADADPLDRPDPEPEDTFAIPATPGTRVVLRGDTLWSIAAEHLAAGTGTPPTDADVARHWLALIDENRPTLSSGDPDLIFPGEVVRLPPLSVDR